MARPVATNSVAPSLGRLPPGLATEEVIYWDAPKGLNFVASLDKVPVSYCTQIQNVMLNKGKLRSRLAVGTLGPSSSDPIMAVFEFVTGSGVRLPLRFTTRFIQKYDGTSWTNLNSTPFTGTAANYFAVTSFFNKLVFSNGVDGLFEFDPTAGSVTQITGVGVPNARYLTTFGNRVIAANTIESGLNNYVRVRWCVKNNELKWDETDQVNVGAGHEDVVSSPGPVVDTVHVCQPITDEAALLMRARSVWVMSQTGFVDAPFKFNLLHDEIGTDSPYSFARVDGGVIGFCKDNFYLIGLQGVKPLGEEVIDYIMSKLLNPRDMVGTFDSIRQEYRCTFPDDPGVVLRYAMKDGGWTRDVYPFGVRALGSTVYSVGGIVIDSLVGFIDGLTGTIDSLGVTSLERGALVGQIGTSSQYVTREDPTRTQDVNTSGSNVDSPIEARTGIVIVPSATSEDKTQLIEIRLKYESAASQTLVFEWSGDSGSTWTALSTQTIGVTTKPSTLRVRQTVTAEAIQIRVRSTTLGKLTIIHLRASALKGAPIAA